MLRSYVISLIRSFIRNRQSTIINIFGLSVGLCSALLIALYAIDEFRYDRFHRDAANIYRFNTQYGPQNEAVPVGPYFLKEHMTDKIPEIISSVRIRPENEDDFWFRYGDRNYTRQNFLLADSNFFSFFSFPLVRGDPEYVLSEPNSIVISESAAQIIFGDSDPFGETILVQGIYPATVTGIMKDFPRHSHFQASIVANNELARDYASFLFDHWGNFSWHYYLLLEDNADPENVKAGINMIIAETVPDLAEIVHFNLQPLPDIRLHSQRIAWDIDTHGNSMLLNGLIAVAVVILLLASVNYINMYTIQATARKKEVGVRKVMGAGRISIFFQSITESFIYVVISFIIALGMAEVMIPFVNELTGNGIDPGMIFSFPEWILLLIVLSVIAVLSGLYPAIIVGRSRPVDIFRSTGTVGDANSFTGRVFKLDTRKVLIVFQFCCATSLIILSLSINSQIRYMMEVDQGYRESGLFVIHNPKGDNQQSRFFRLKNSLEQYPEINLVTSGHTVPSERLHSFTYIRLPEDDYELQIGIINVHKDYFAALGSETIAGRVFEYEDSSAPSSNVVINSTAVRALGKSPEDIIGSELVTQSAAENLHVIGVVRDIHFYSLHELITPMLFIAGNRPQTYENILISADCDMLSTAIEISRDVWQQEFEDYPFNFSVLQDRLANLYGKETRTARLTSVFMFLAILISLMGLYALASFVIYARVKEIAVRKVLGAGQGTILKMIVSEFTILLLVSTLLAWPIMWLAVNRWLENFAYREEINYFFFLAASLISLAAAGITISYHAYRAASSNPAHALKYE